MELKNKVVLITGGSSGIGLALAQEMGRRGAKVAITGRNAERLEAATQQLQQAGLAAYGIAGDVAQKADCQRMVEATAAHFGGLDVLINNAGISMKALFQELELEVMEQVMQINFMGTVYCTRYAMPYLLKGEGAIVGISSVAGFRGLPGRTAYSASKHAMHGFLEALRTELLRKPVQVLLACPGFTASNIRKAALNAQGQSQGESSMEEGAMMSAEEVAQRIGRALEQNRRSLVLTRQGKLTVLLNKWLPGLMDKMVYKHFSQERDSLLD